MHAPGLNCAKNYAQPIGDVDRILLWFGFRVGNQVNQNSLSQLLTEYRIRQLSDL
jgi:hypothetical protein